MIDFILSKMGILLFAITMAGLLLFFADNIKEVFLADETIQISNVLAKQMKYMAESENTCASTKVILPKYIDIYGVTSQSSSTSIYYTLDINKIKQGETGESFIVFTIINKKNKKTIALESFRTKANIYFASSDNSTPQATDSISIDPTGLEVIYMVKSKIVDNEDNLQTDIYFVNCDYDTKFASGIGFDSTAASKSAFDSCFSTLEKIQVENKSDYPFFCVSKPTMTVGAS